VRSFADRMYRFVQLAAIVLGCAIIGHAQTATLSGVALDTNGNPVAGAAVTVCPANTSGIPCGNPLQTTQSGRDGSWIVYINSGTYTVTVNRGGLVSTTQQMTTGALPPQTISNGITTPSIDGIIFVDGVTYPRTCAGINQAIQAAPAGNGTQNPLAAAGTIVQWGPGDIPCSVTILIDRPITLRGVGVAGRLVPQPGFAGPVIKADCSDGKGVTDNFSACIGTRLEQIWIEDTSFRSQNTDGIWLLHQAELMAYNVEVKWLKGYALQFDNNGNNNTPNREDNFYNFVSWGNGDPAQSKASIMLITNSFVGSDENNEIRFIGGGVKNEWWEAIRIGTGQIPGVGLAKGPRHIYFDNFQVEARQDLDCANCTTAPPAVAPLSDNVHILYGNDLAWMHSSLSNSGQGKSTLRIDGDVNNPVRNVVLRDTTIGGTPQLAGNLTCTAVANSVCTWVSGNQFLPFDSASWVGLTISIPAAACTTSCIVSSIQSATQITLTTNTGSITNTAYTVTSGGWGVTANWVNALSLEGVNWIGNPLGNLNPTIAGTQNYTILDDPGTAPSIGTDVFGVRQCLGTGCVMSFQNNTPSTGQRWSLNSQGSGQFTISPSTGNALSILNLGGTTGVPNSLNFKEVTATSALATTGFGNCYADSTSHLFRCNSNGSSRHTMLGVTEFGSCAMSAGTTCTFTATNGFNSTPFSLVAIDQASAPPATAINAKCSISGTTVTITAGASNSLTWDCVLIGNPN
jgi:hypothetical protein